MYKPALPHFKFIFLIKWYLLLKVKEANYQGHIFLTFSKMSFIKL